MLVDRQKSRLVSSTSIFNGSGCSDENRKRIEISRSAMTKLQNARKFQIIPSLSTLLEGLYISIFFYGVEAWSLLGSDRRRVYSFVM